ncbi:MAG: GNAT family N-acetyltransferase [Clostridia bacterium]|nr:GNAT family N-acetyltransferase [Clostridia bacterium]
MQLELVPVRAEEKEILRNLMEKYDYEFSQYDDRDVNILGLYGYDYFDCYWTEDTRYPFFIKADGKLAGFVMVGNYMEFFPEAKHSMAEFFVLYKYRRCGVGTFAATEVFRRFPGLWELRCHPKNTTSVFFWDKVIRENTHDVLCIPQHPENPYDDGSPSRVYRFDTSK